MTTLCLANYSAKSPARDDLERRAETLWPKWTPTQRARWIEARLNAGGLRVAISRAAAPCQMRFARTLREAFGYGASGIQ